MDLSFEESPPAKVEGKEPSQEETRQNHVDLSSIDNIDDNHNHVGCSQCQRLEEQLKAAEKARDKLKGNLKKVKETMIDTGKLVGLYKEVEKGEMPCQIAFFLKGNLEAARI